MEKRLIEQKIKEYTKPKAEMIKFSNKDVLATSAATFNSNNYDDDIKEDKKGWLDDYYERQAIRDEEERKQLRKEIEFNDKYGWERDKDQKIYEYEQKFGRYDENED